MAGPPRVCTLLQVDQLAEVLRKGTHKLLLIDSRPFLEYNTCHITSATNICSSKIVKRRLQQDKVTVRELLVHFCEPSLDESWEVVVYDQGSWQPPGQRGDTFLGVLVQKLLLSFRSVALLAGGFAEFEGRHRRLCEDKRHLGGSQLTSLSQPCLPISNHGPTRILPFLYLGSQQDAHDRNLLKDYNITYEVNVSTSCPKPDFIQDAHFLRIPVNDNYIEKLVPYFTEAFHFLDKVRVQSGTCALVHCLAGVSRSPTVAIAYVMKHLRMTSDEAYRYVKSKRPTISPNFNFLGQLLEYEKQLRRERVLEPNGSQSEPPPSARPPCNAKPFFPSENLGRMPPPLPSQLELPLLSPSRALAKLSFDRPPVKRASYEVGRSRSDSWVAATMEEDVQRSSWMEATMEQPSTSSDCEVVLRKGSGRRRDPSGHDSAYRSLTLEDEEPAGGGSAFHERSPLRSPLSPSERHLLEDFVDVGEGPKETADTRGLEAGGRTELESSHDSGITSASSCSSWSQPLLCSRTNQPRGFSSTDLLSSSSSSSSLASEDCPAPQQPPSAALPRAHSCPVIVSSWLQKASSWDGSDFVPLRRGCGRASTRNRYSCGSLEYAADGGDPARGGAGGGVVGGPLVGGPRRPLGRPVSLIPVS